MVDAGPYEAMRDAGATPTEVCRAALDRGLVLIEAVVVLRQVFALSLAHAKALADAVQRTADPDVWFHVFAIDPRSGAVTLQTSHAAPLELMRKVLLRPPDFDRSDVLSWGNVTRSELEDLAMSDALDAGAVEDDMRANPPETTIWSIFHRCTER